MNEEAFLAGLRELAREPVPGPLPEQELVIRGRRARRRRTALRTATAAVVVSGADQRGILLDGALRERTQYELGKSRGTWLDFVPRDPAPPAMRTFWMLHAAYTSLEMVKLAGGFLLAFWIAAVPRPPRESPAALSRSI